MHAEVHKINLWMRFNSRNVATEYVPPFVQCTSLFLLDKSTRGSTWISDRWTAVHSQCQFGQCFLWRQQFYLCAPYYQYWAEWRSIWQNMRWCARCTRMYPLETYTVLINGALFIEALFRKHARITLYLQYSGPLICHNTYSITAPTIACSWVNAALPAAPLLDINKPILLPRKAYSSLSC